MDQGQLLVFLKGDLLHWVHTSVDEHIEKANRFSTIGAREYFNAGKRPRSYQPFITSSGVSLNRILLKVVLGMVTTALLFAQSHRTPLFSIHEAPFVDYQGKGKTTRK
jgi:hypothetical protein